MRSFGAIRRNWICWTEHGILMWCGSDERLNIAENISTAAICCRCCYCCCLAVTVAVVIDLRIFHIVAAVSFNRHARHAIAQWWWWDLQLRWLFQFNPVNIGQRRTRVVAWLVVGWISRGAQLIVLLILINCMKYLFDMRSGFPSCVWLSVAALRCISRVVLVHWMLEADFWGIPGYLPTLLFYLLTSRLVAATSYGYLPLTFHRLLFKLINLE